MLTKITLENFFSFGRSTTIELNAGVNLLVGINGSGKSNLLKAIKLLVFGAG
jgi:chromosome segregation ATPase